MEIEAHLKRFRGAALFILVMHGIALAIGIFLVGTGEGEEVARGRMRIIGAALVILPALMAWNASLLGAGALVLLLGAELVLGAGISDGAFVPLIRGLLYLGLSLWLLRELIQYRRKLSKTDDPIDGSAAVRWGGAGLVAVVASVITVSLSGVFTQAPPTGVLTARQITGDQYRWMYENNILGRAERLFLFSKDSGKAFSDSGNLLTNQFVGAWWRDEGELESGWIRLGEICRVEKTSTSEDVDDTLYTIHTFGDDSWLRILLPKQDGGDREFLSRMNYLNDKNMHSEVRNACDENRSPNWDSIAAGNGIERDIVESEDVDYEHLNWLRHNDFLTQKERLLKFYSHGNYSISTGGLLLTDTYFGGWSEDTDGLQSWWFKLGEICTLSKIEDATKSSGPLYKAESVDNWFQFNLPEKDGQDVLLIKQVNAMNAAARTEPLEKSCKAMLQTKIDEAKADLETGSEETASED